MAKDHKTLRLLIVEDSVSDANLIVRRLHTEGYRLEWQRVETEHDFLAALEKPCDLILSDWILPEFSGLTATRLLQQRGVDIPILIISGRIGEDAAIAAMREGAGDYIFKDHLERLDQAIQNALEKRQLRIERAQARAGAERGILLDSIQTQVWTMMNDRTYGSVNSAHAAFIGRRQEDMAFKSLEDLDLAYSGKLDFFYQRTQQVFATGKASHAEVWMVNANRQSRLLSIYQSPILGPDGTVTQVVCSAEDITERKQAEDALRESEEKHRVLLEESSDSIFSFTPEGQYIYANHALARAFGKPVEEIIGKRIWDFFPKEEADRRFALLSQVFQRGQEQMVEGIVPNSEGGHYFMTVIKPIKNAEGKVVTAICSSRDITQRKRAEEALRESEEKFRRIVESSPMAMYLYQLAEDNRLILIGANASADKLIGVDHQTLLGKTIEEAFPNLVSTNIPQMYRKVASGELQSQSFEIAYQDERFSGYYDVRVFQTTANHIAVDFLDITDRKRAENEITHMNRQLESALVLASEMAVKAQTATVAKSRFLANMSHEIRTPLNAILGFSQLLQQDAQLSPQQLKRIETINRSGEHLLALLNEILELSKIESGAAVISNSNFDLHQLLNDLAAIFHQRAEAKQVAFEIVGMNGVPQRIISDELKLRQVLINLLGNAVKFTNAGRVLLRVRTEPSGNAEGDEMSFIAEVEDSGPGIAPEEMEQLFVAFEQTQSGRRTGQGTGLGLTISRQYAHILGGSLTATSKINQGSVFRFEIPICAAATPAAPKTSHPGRILQLMAGGPPCKVMVVEDKEDNRALMIEILETIGFEVQVARNGTEALATFANWRPQLILMDSQMPGMNGDEATRQIRRAPGGDQVKIITLTAGAGEENRNVSMASGADDFIAKPFRQNELLEKIRVHTGVRYLYAETEGPHPHP